MSVIQFPKQNRRPHRSSFIAQQAVLPANVVRMPQRPVERLTKSPELLLALLMIQAADATTRRCVRDNILNLALAGDEEAAILKPLAEAL